jgi:hypothetical protein
VLTPVNASFAASSPEFSGIATAISRLDGMRLPLRIVLIVLLAMLQGIAPILHAHVGHDQPESGAFHFHIAALGGDERTQRYDNATLRDSGAVIGVADEMRRDEAIALKHGGICAVRVHIESECRRTAACGNPWRTSTAWPFALPLSQAPPAGFPQPLGQA